MISADKLKTLAFQIKNKTDFENLSLKVFQFQYQFNAVYKEYCTYLGVNIEEVKKLSDIPHLPISFFKTHKVVNSNQEADIVFTSSGTSGSTFSKHFVNDLKVYEESFITSFEYYYKDPKEYCVLALLPSYLEREGSSLVYMVDSFIKRSKYSNSGFYLNNYKDLKKALESNNIKNIPTILIGVSFGLLDFCEVIKKIEVKDLIVMETGGMKGRRKEITREELHAKLKKCFQVKNIHSEYGMTELLSQAYSSGDGKFRCPPWMEVNIRNQDDPFNYCNKNEIGGINVIDLANIDSCSFIQTEDLGKINEDGTFEVIGRFDNSEIRGCNLMIN